MRTSFKRILAERVAISGEHKELILAYEEMQKINKGILYLFILYSFFIIIVLVVI